MIKKVIGIVIALFIIFSLSGCIGDRSEVYNDADRNDLLKPHKDISGYYVCSIKFEVLQLKQVSQNFKYTEKSICFGFFLFFGGTKIKTDEGIENKNYYYAFVRNINGGIYFAKIPASKVRIYQDLKDGDPPTFVGQIEATEVLPENESDWENYSQFNLHVKPGTIIPNWDGKIDLSKFN
jgi:hypothetical protein